MRKLIFLFFMTIFANGLLFAGFMHSNINIDKPKTAKPEVISVLTQGDTMMLFQVKTLTANGQYAPRHVLAIWITNENDQYITSLKVRAATYKAKLNKWKTYSGGTVPTDAISGASLTSHQTHIVAWNGKNVSGNVVPDGNYRIYVEFNESNSTSGNPFTYVTFTKGATNEHLSPSNTTYFQNMDIQYFAPTNISISESEKNISFSVSPNPVKDVAQIQVVLAKTEKLSVDIFSINGKRIHSFQPDTYSEGQHTFLWYPSDTDAKSGIYFARLTAGKSVKILKIIVK